MEMVIGIDIGGTKIKAALVDTTGHILYETETKWADHKSENPDDLKLLYTIIQKLLDKSGAVPIGIGIGVPGVIDYNRGMVIWAPGPQWRNLALQSLVHQQFNLPVFLENDVNLATLGEFGFGAGVGARNMVCIMIGTGIGSGIIINGTLHHGAHNSAGEIGYMLPSTTYLRGNYLDFGALESVASGTGIAQQVTDPQITAEMIFQAALDKKEWAETIVKQTTDYFVLMLTNICAVLDPERIILSGGVIEGRGYLVESIQPQLENVLPNPPELVISILGSSAGVKGAVTLVLHELLKTK